MNLPRHQLRWIVLLVDAGLLTLTALWSWRRGIEVWPRLAFSPSALGWGLGGAVGMVGANFALLGAADRLGWETPRRWLEELFLPLFGRLPLGDIALISVGAGLCEEALFRGVIQPEFGLLAASLIFGACHVASRELVSLGIWAAVTGLFLGGLSLWADSLFAPALAHGLYDFVALCYVRYGPHGRAREEPEPLNETDPDLKSDEP